MHYSNYIEKILDLQEVKVDKIENKEKITEIYVSKPRKQCNCPCCGKLTDKIHDYRYQKVKDLPSFGKDVILIVKKRRYRCLCGKRFFESNEFLAKYQRRTIRTTAAIINELSDTKSYKEVAKKYKLSIATVIRIFGIISYPKPKELPEVIGIDEFKGNTGSEKYQCILTDISNKKIMDILPTRYQYKLCQYFKQYSREDRSKVKFFVSDMYNTYAEMAKTYFPNAIYIIDKYHWIRQAIWAFENVRKETQKKFSKDYRIYFKHSRKLLLKRQSKLSRDEMQEVNIMLYASSDLLTSYTLKEMLYEILDTKDEECRENLFKDWIACASDSGIGQFEKCASTYRNWFKPILNSLKYPFSNGFTEGCNNKIKVLKRNAYGCKKFFRFRNRIMFIFDKSC